MTTADDPILTLIFALFFMLVTLGFLLIPFVLKRHTKNMEGFGPQEAFKGAPNHFGQIQWTKGNAPVHGKIPVNHVSLILRDNQLTGTFHAYINEQKGRFYHHGEIFLEASADTFVGRVRAYEGNRDFASYVVHGTLDPHNAEICFGKPKSGKSPTIQLAYANEKIKIKTTPQVITHNEMAASSHLLNHQGKISGSIPQARNWGEVEFNISAPEATMLSFVALALCGNAILSTQKSKRS